MRRAVSGFCEDCGVLVTRMWQNGRALLCLDCGAARTVQAAMQIHNKSGPIYEKQQAGIKRYQQAQKEKEK